MAITKSAFLRYRTLDRCLRNKGRKYTLNDLLEKVNETLQEENLDSSGIAKRQLQYDIEFMKSTNGYSAPIIHFQEGMKHYYHYEDKNFSINNEPLNETEVEQLRSALAMLSRFEGAPQFEWLAEMMPILSDTFKLEGNQKKVMGFDSNIDYTGNERLPTIFSAIVNKRVIEVTYKPYNQPSSKIVFHPHYLKQHNHRWFAFGKNHNPPNELQHVSDLWNLALDRVESIKETDEEYQESEIDWEEDYFGDIFGVTKTSDTPETIVLWFTPEQAPYITTKALHRSQRPPEIHPDGSITLRMQVIPNYELETLILSFGEKVKVKAPESLVTRIKERLTNSISNY